MQKDFAWRGFLVLLVALFGLAWAFGQIRKWLCVDELSEREDSSETS